MSLSPTPGGAVKTGKEAITLGISPETAPLVIEALRLYAQMKTGEPANYKVERWDLQGAHVEEIVATATLVMIGHAAFHAAVEQYPGASLTLRQGARVILKSPD